MKEASSKKRIKSFIIGVLATIKGALLWLIGLISSPKAEKIVEGIEEGLDVIKGVQKKAKSGTLKDVVDKEFEKVEKIVENV